MSKNAFKLIEKSLVFAQSKNTLNSFQYFAQNDFITSEGIFESPKQKGFTKEESLGRTFTKYPNMDLTILGDIGRFVIAGKINGNGQHQFYEEACQNIPKYIGKSNDININISYISAIGFNYESVYSDEEASKLIANKFFKDLPAINDFDASLQFSKNITEHITVSTVIDQAEWKEGNSKKTKKGIALKINFNINNTQNTLPTSFIESCLKLECKAKVEYENMKSTIETIIFHD